MQRRQYEEEKGKVSTVRLKEEEKEKEKQRKGSSGVRMWSRVRCIPQPSAVCSSIRTQIAHPIVVQVCVIKLWLFDVRTLFGNGVSAVTSLFRILNLN